MPQQQLRTGGFTIHMPYRLSPSLSSPRKLKPVSHCNDYCALEHCRLHPPIHLRAPKTVTDQ